MEQLPQELLLMIISHLPMKVLASFSSTSTYHRDLVEPTLYQEIRWEQDHVKNHPPPVHLLLRTLLNRPELASHIQCLGMCCHKPYDFYGVLRGAIPMQDDKPDFTSSEMECVTSLIHSFHFAHEDFWMAALNRVEVDIFVALVLSQLTNLRRLYLDNDYLVATLFIGPFLENVVATGSALRALEHVEYSNDIRRLSDSARNKSIDRRQVTALFSIPSLNSISMSLHRWAIDLVHFPISNLKSLVLHHGDVSPDHLGTLLRATPSLTSLRYEACINIHRDYGCFFRGSPIVGNSEARKIIDCAQLGRSLAHVRNSLERLFISIGYFSQALGPEFFAVKPKQLQGKTGKLDSLHTFKKLSSLTMPTILLTEATTPTDLRVLDKLEDLPAELAILLPTTASGGSLMEIHLSDDLYGPLEDDQLDFQVDGSDISSVSDTATPYESPNFPEDSSDDEYDMDEISD